LGVGTIYRDDEQPKLHIHTAIGKENQVMVGCPRGGASTFLILEVTIIEIDEVEARRQLDEATGLNLLKFE
jgi:predicted DNA-binding protein with PD1-like motif